MTQLALDLDLATLAPEHDDDEPLTLQERFERFHGRNPWVLAALEDLTGDWLAQGHDRAGIGRLVEVLRWQYGRRTYGDAFKLPNAYRSRYARLMIARHPEWAEVFDTRELRTA